MFPILLFTSMIEPDNQIILADAHRFGVSYEVAILETSRADKQRAIIKPEVLGWSSHTIFLEWETECAWRLHVWCILWDALNEHLSDRVRLSKLYELRREIGHKAFYEGKIPSPTPYYRR